jgi:hypothetical protein
VIFNRKTSKRRDPFREKEILFDHVLIHYENRCMSSNSVVSIDIPTRRYLFSLETDTMKEKRIILFSIVVKERCQTGHIEQVSRRISYRLLEDHVHDQNTLMSLFLHTHTPTPLCVKLPIICGLGFRKVNMNSSYGQSSCDGISQLCNVPKSHFTPPFRNPLYIMVCLLLSDNIIWYRVLNVYY